MILKEPRGRRPTGQQNGSLLSGACRLQMKISPGCEASGLIVMHQENHDQHGIVGELLAFEAVHQLVGSSPPDHAKLILLKT